jgi:GT2 family glycosyltransferase
MALLSMAIYSTPENGKDEYLEKTLESLWQTVFYPTANKSSHRLILSVNSFTEETIKIIEFYKAIISQVIYNDHNLGTAEAINLAWKTRRQGESAIKLDDDVVIHHQDWIYLMEEAIRRDPKIGQIGLKRRDCSETPWNPDPFYQSKLEMLPHIPGEKWIVIEEVSHVMGTCVMHSSALLDKVGYLYQPKLYGFDDSFMSYRSRMAGFRNVFLPGIDIEHIDRGDTGFQKWKTDHAGECWQAYIETIRAYKAGTKSIYYNPFEK